MSSSIQIFHYRDIPNVKNILEKIRNDKITKSKKHLDDISATSVLDYTISDVTHVGMNIRGSFGYGYNESYPTDTHDRKYVRKYAGYHFTISYEHKILILHGSIAKNKPVLQILSIIINEYVGGFVEINLSKKQIRYVHDHILTYVGNELYLPYFIKGEAFKNERNFINYGLSQSCATNDPKFESDYKWASTWNPKWEIIKCIGIIPIHEPQSRKLQIKIESCFTLTGDIIPYVNWDTFVFKIFVKAWYHVDK